MGEATIRDVARHAQVSVASVSRALNGRGNVQSEMRERVLAAASALGYVPHAGARSLSMARTQAIGVVLPDLHGEFFSELMRGLDIEAHQRRYQLLLSNMHADVSGAGEALRTMRGRVDALVVMAPEVDPDRLRAALPPSIPTLLIAAPPGLGDHSLAIDNAAGAAAMTRHLIAGGCRRIVHISGPEGNRDAAERRAAFAAVVAEAPDVEGTVLFGDFRDQSGVDIARHLVADGLPCDAIFAANDAMAMGAMLVLREAGFGMPGDVAVAGFDDVPLAVHLGLTTMRVHVDRIGQTAIRQLVERLEGGGRPVAGQLMVPELIVRATTRPTGEER